MTMQLSLFPMLSLIVHPVTVLKLPICTSQSLNLFHPVLQPLSPLTTFRPFSIAEFVSALFVPLFCLFDPTYK